jgi:hypothetical protein
MREIVRRYRIWKLNRRINRLLDEAGMPAGSKVIFTGNVQIDEVVYESSDL